MTLTVIISNGLEYEYNIGEHSKDFEDFGTGKLSQLVIVERSPEIHRGYPISFKFSRKEQTGE